MGGDYDGDDDVGGDNDGYDGGVGGADQIGEVQATPSSSTAAASQHSSVWCCVRTTAQ